MTNLNKLFWPHEGISKRDLLQYYADISGALLPHLKNRAMVLKRYPNGPEQAFFFQKRIPEPHPEWIETCEMWWVPCCWACTTPTAGWIM